MCTKPEVSSVSVDRAGWGIEWREVLKLVLLNSTHFECFYNACASDRWETKAPCEVNSSDVCFLHVCAAQRVVMETTERRDAISPFHINSSGWSGRERAMREGLVCFCLPLQRAVFLMVPEINSGQAQAEQRERDDYTKCNSHKPKHRRTTQELSISLALVPLPFSFCLAHVSSQVIAILMLATQTLFRRENGMLDAAASRNNKTALPKPDWKRGAGWEL